MSASGIYLPDLPRPDVIEQVDFESIYADLVNQFNGYQPLTLDVNKQPVITEAVLVESASGEKYWKVPADELQGLFYVGLESDPVARQFLVFAYREMLMRQRANDSCHAVMPVFATGNDLDNIVARKNLYRLVVTPATDNTSAVMESDAALLRRFNLAYDGYTTAGSHESYIYHSLSADGAVKDAYPHSPEPTENVVYVLSHHDNGVPDQALLETVNTALNISTVRPNSELVTVAPAEVIDYEIRATITFNAGPAVQPLLDAAQARAEAWASANFMLGRDVTRSAIDAQLHIAELLPGMHEVTLQTALPIRVAPHQAARCTGVHLTYGGRDV